MRRIIIIVALLAVVGIGGFLFMFKREALLDMVSSGRGYPKAKTAQECVDLFQKAIKDRKYDMAARYCTKEYAEQLTRGNDAAVALGESIDGVLHRLKSDGLVADDKNPTELQGALSFYDPFPTNIKLTLQNSGDKEAFASIGFEGPAYDSKKTAPLYTWPDNHFYRAYCFDYFASGVKLVKDSDGWKLNFPVTPKVSDRIDAMNKKHKDFVNAFKVMAEELRVDRTTKNDAAKRMYELLVEANK